MLYSGFPKVNLPSDAIENAHGAGFFPVDQDRTHVASKQLSQACAGLAAERYVRCPREMVLLQSFRQYAFGLHFIL